MKQILTGIIPRMVILNQRMNPKGTYSSNFNQMISNFPFRIIPNNNDFTKSLASLVIPQDDQVDDEPK